MMNKRKAVILYGLGRMYFNGDSRRYLLNPSLLMQFEEDGILSTDDNPSMEWKAEQVIFGENNSAINPSKRAYEISFFDWIKKGKPFEIPID